MRLKTSDCQQICALVKGYFSGYPGELLLYGSRVHDHLKGGDIDLVVILESKIEVDNYKIVAAIKNAIGDQKIDFSVIEKAAKTAPFWAVALENVAVLCSWK